MIAPLDFEKHISDLESKLSELQHLSARGDLNIAEEMERLHRKKKKLLEQTYSSLSPWQKVQVARHMVRPRFKEYTEGFIEDFTPLAGDRAFGEDAALMGGLGRFQGQPVVCMGHQKGWDTDSRIKHNFGMPRPEGYRKARRLMEMAERFKLPLITLVDTAGAHPGVDAEERGQSEAIARCIETSMTLTVPVISVITGEGGSGGAIAIAVANNVHMLEHSVYSVISPEGCASILWRTAEKKELAAKTLRLTAQDLHVLGVVDSIIPEPLGGAHRDVSATVNAVEGTISKSLSRLSGMGFQALKNHRREKFLAMGQQGL